MIKEINSIIRLIDNEKNKCTSIYFGGGTPSIMPKKYLKKIMDSLKPIVDKWYPEISFIDRNMCNSLYGVDPYLDQKELFDILKAVGHITIDERKIFLKKYFRQIYLFTLCYFIDMKEPLRQKMIEMKTE